MNSNNSIELKKVDETDFPFLYKLLENRNPDANISHRKMPTYEEHVDFIKSKPYSEWYIILTKNNRVGSIYLSKQDEIGIFLENQIQGKGIGNKALDLLIKKHPRKKFLANVNPKNKKSIQFFEKNDFKLIQYTYELIIKE